MIATSPILAPWCSIRFGSAKITIDRNVGGFRITHRTAGPHREDWRREWDPPWLAHNLLKCLIYTPTLLVSENPPCESAGSGFYRPHDPTRLPGQRIAARSARIDAGRVGRPEQTGRTQDRSGVFPVKCPDGGVTRSAGATRSL